MPYELDIIRPGWTRTLSDGLFSSGCTITLLRGPENILIDPGSPWDSDWLLSELKKRHLDPSQIDYVICTHEHVDHLGSLHLFNTTTNKNLKQIIVGNTVLLNKENHYSRLSNPFSIDPDVKIVTTPGHTLNDITILAKCSISSGLVAITGDLFESQTDIENPSEWKQVSLDVNLQKHYRNLILNQVDLIVPGHGAPFKVEEKWRS